MHVDQDRQMIREVAEERDAILSKTKLQAPPHLSTAELLDTTLDLSH